LKPSRNLSTNFEFAVAYHWSIVRFELCLQSKAYLSRIGWLDQATLLSEPSGWEPAAVFNRFNANLTGLIADNNIGFPTFLEPLA